MPNLVKKGSRAVLAVIQCVVQDADEAMSLFNCGVPRSEAELMVRYGLACSTSGRRRLRRGFPKTLEAMGKRLMGR
jgi:hypothetical protein